MERELLVPLSWARVQGLPVNAPLRLLVDRVAWPVGKFVVPLSVSVTVTVQVVDAARGTDGGAQVTTVDVLRLVEDTEALPPPELALPR